LNNGSPSAPMPSPGNARLEVCSAMQDPLTGPGNRNPHLRSTCNGHVCARNGANELLALVLIDLDSFIKAIKRRTGTPTPAIKYLSRCRTKLTALCPGDPDLAAAAGGR